MPPVFLPDEQLEDLAMYLKGQVSPPNHPYFLSRPTLPTLETGQQKFTTLGCIGCHQHEASTSDHKTPLRWIPAMNTLQEVRVALKRPHINHLNSNRFMLSLRDHDIDVLAPYLISLGKTSD